MSRAGSGLLKYEGRHAELLPFGQFLRRFAVHVLVASLAILFSLGVGMLGYMHFEGMTRLDAYLNTAMLLGGMGPVKTEGMSNSGKLFAGTYALYAGLVFIVVSGIIVAPILHRILHYLHLESEKSQE